MEPECLLWRLLGTHADGWAVVEMSASGSEAAAARERTGDPPRLVAVPGAGNGRVRAHPARSVVFLGVADDASSRVAAALCALRSKGRVRAVSASPASVDPDPAVAAALAELGVHLAAMVSRRPSPALLAGADLVVIMGYAAGDPAGGRPSEDWCIDDPRGKDPDAVRCIRDALDRRVQRLLIRLGVAVPMRRR
jgi:protein-tyrosine-phosphatase